MIREMNDQRVQSADLRQVCAEMERRLCAGENCTAESLLASHSQLASDTDAALEVIYTEFVAREHLGQQPVPAEFCQRFPQFRDELEKLFQIHDAAGGANAVRAVRESAIPLVDNGCTQAVDETSRDRSLRRFGNYEILGEIGRGGMGVVYKARQAGLNRMVALKMILTGDDAGSRRTRPLSREAEAAARLQHPNIVQIHEIGEHEGRPFLSLEFVAGGTLEDALVGTPWPSTDSARLVETLARALHHAHQQGVVHRDLKPANILMQPAATETTSPKVPEVGSEANLRSLSPSAESPHRSAADCVPKVTDFGLARRLSEGETGTQGPTGPTQTGAILGTPAYMSPEQTFGDGREVGPAADIYALGAILYELLTGRPPFLGVSILDTLEQVRERDPLPPKSFLPGLARDLETICLKCLRKEPAQRYETAAALAEDLGRFQRGEPVDARPTPSWEKAWKWSKRRPAIVFLLGLLAATVAASLTVTTVLWRQTAAAFDRERAQKNELEATLASKLITLAQRDWMAGDLESARQHLEACPLAYHGAEWRYLDRVCNGCLRVLTTDELPASMQPVAWSQDGRSIAAPSILYGKIIVWDPMTGVRRCTIRNPIRYSAYRLAFNAEGRLVSVGSEGATIMQVCSVKTWDPQNGREVSSQVVTSPGDARIATLSANGRRIALAHQGALMLVDLPGMPMPTSLTENPKELMSPRTLSDDGRLFAWRTNRKELRIWDTVTQQTITPPFPTEVGQILTFSPDASRIAASAYRRETNGVDVTVRDVQTGKEIIALRSSAGDPIICVAFSPDGRRFATTGVGHCVVVWDLDSGRESLTFRGHRDKVLSLAFSPDGDRLASGSSDGTVRIWDVRPFEKTRD